jgi:hypothetical protein
MKNLIDKLTADNQSKLNDFTNDLNNINNLDEILNKWYYKELIPKTNKKVFTIETIKPYLIERKNKQLNKQLAKDIKKINTISNGKEFESIIINVEWKKSYMWGYNPRAEARVYYKDHSGNYFDSGSIGGCGYDKLSTAVANSLNQVNGLLKLLYDLKDKNITVNNHEFFGYGSGYGLLPYFEGGVGVSCYNTIFNKLGYEFKQITSGKSFDVFQISKL